jgi:hypothetical protein
MNVLLIVVRDFALRTFKQRPILSVLAIAFVTVISGLSYAKWLNDLFITEPLK